ncbi:Lrp/AsnC family transcriptional regulator [Novosphingobium album (ex Liu et al. 2023)]|uniref:Lrp/AsnC family transcriptional regulator n=1 Tax=Novosphingobium album (ex Liu et al. 2023) TaxID=3031130 RepID=A0ABT5WMB4_9SPHN|nr:Lrp/AsnC family transcriptional regulator [Novosphingobium album (ex Liu et al. 2023)]MDE8651187.1 Lrp/AsnC family transcriptional regulator [Novosphingobium album (ex Liu et al. 2023)]
MARPVTDRRGSPPAKEHVELPSELDACDMKILKALVNDGRISWRDLSDQIGLSLTPTLRRVRRLEAAGFIESYTATLDEQRLVGSLSVFVSVTLDKQSEDTLTAFEAHIGALEEVTSCFMMTGNVDYLMRVVVRDLNHYQRLLIKLTRIPNVAHVNSSFALKAVVRRSGFYI